MTSLVASRVLTPAGWTGPARVQIEDGVIAAVQPYEPHSTAPDACDGLLVPGFVDLQVNGIDDTDVASAAGDDWERLDQLLLAQGVTTWCPTLVTMPLAAYARPLARIAEAMARPVDGRPTIAGAHLEGPFLGAAPGAHPRELITPIDLEWLRALPAHVALVTLGAEQPAAEAATALLAAAGRLVSIGHTMAGEHQFDAVVAAGARLTTHLFNGMSGLHHRSPGVAAFALTNPVVCASLIADGVHVHPRMLKLAFAALGGERAVLVTDAVAWRRGTVGGIGLQFRDGAPRLADGTLAGSAVSMDAAIRLCVASGVPLADALVAASTNPARLLGLRDRGTVQVGMRADLVLLSAALEVQQVWVAGVPVRPAAG
ncbi:MAG: amidohydrolase family protein [Actinomycetota bacterium]|nr:amidohydrolase family protein [Actinomycetota bacterium]